MTLQDTVTVPSTPDGVGRALDFLEAALAAGKIPELMHGPVHLAVDEALQNIISYSGAAAITLMVEAADAYVAVTIVDDGEPFDPLTAPAPDVTAELDEREIGGLGIYLIRQSMDEVSYTYRDEKNVLRLVKRP
ncbi:MAG: ATP-binding protein [Methanoregulaceae archaeon]|jgi:anti-sigma regulatory factor (Ser/Thr protein kinase)